MFKFVPRAQDSTLSADAVAGWLCDAYDLPDFMSCRFFRKGICDTYRVVAGEAEFYLKVYRHGRRSKLDVAEEVRLLNHLADHGVAVAKPMAKRDGAFVSELAAPEGPRCAVLFEAAVGAHGDDGDPKRILLFAEAVARMHTAADEMAEPYERVPLDMDHLLGENLEAIRPFMAHRPDDLSLIERIAEESARVVEELLPKTKPEYGICHGDLHGGDVCYRDGGAPILFDFDSSGIGWRALDIGVFLASDDWMDTTAEAEHRRQTKLATFLEGYGMHRTLSKSELAAIQLTPPIRHIFLMGHVLRYTTVTQGHHWANDSFIDWHMAWFRHWSDRHL